MWRDPFFGMPEIEARNAADADDPAAIPVSKSKMPPGPIGADVMEAFMVDLRDVLIERDEFEIAQCDRLVRLQQPLCVRTLPLFEKISDRSNFSLDVALAREIVGSYEPRKMQEKLTAQGQRIYCSLTRVRKDIVLMGAYKRYQVVYGEWSREVGKLLASRLRSNWV
jgi:hypothetical protein